jgi:hypothetical protein
MPEQTEGSRLVVVFDLTEEMNILGLGSCRIEDVTIVNDDDTKVLDVLHDHPVITMEDGEMICGIECWWIPLAEFVSANQQVLPAYGYRKGEIPP